MVKHVISWKDWDSEAIAEIVELAIKMKNNPENYKDSLNQKSLIMLFEKSSTRTRLSFEIGMTKLGGHAVFLEWAKSNIGITEVALEGRVMARYSDFIMARLKYNKTLLGLAQGSTVPVINALCEKYHPCQALADYMTAKENVADLKNTRMIYVGMYNNVANSLVSAGTKLGVEVFTICPEKNQPALDDELMEQAKATGLWTETLDIKKALDTDKKCFVYTDTWVDLEHFKDPAYAEEKERRLNTMMPFQVNKEFISSGKEEPYVMHCMPIHLGYEMNEDVLPDKYDKCIIYDQAENRMWTEMALLHYLNEHN